MNQRNGTDVDAANVMKVFTKLGYKVKVYNDQSVEQLKQVLISGKFEAKCVQHTKHNTKAPNIDPIYLKKMKSMHLSFFPSVKGRSQQQRLICLCSVESWRWGCVLWNRWLHRAQVPDITFSRRSLQITGGKAQTLLYPGIITVCLFSHLFFSLH